MVKVESGRLQSQDRVTRSNEAPRDTFSPDTTGSLPCTKSEALFTILFEAAVRPAPVTGSLRVQRKARSAAE